MSTSITSTARPAAHAKELAKLILAQHGEGGAAAGARLPTERQLADEFAVTRTVVRNALAVLEAEGKVSREVGRGTFVRGHSPGSSTAPAQSTGTDSGEVSPADVMAARNLIEPQVLPLVVAWATQRDFDEMRRCIAGGGAAENYGEFEQWDFALHHAIVVASRNPLLVAMYEVVERARRGELWGSLKRRNDSRERRAIYQADHEALVAALCARELDSAVEVLERHLARVRSNLLGPGEQPPAGV
jgi:GntR family uxuAB operon transcriptional repressor